VACHAGDLGCLLALLWLFEDRESLYDILSTGTGARMHASAVSPGGIRSTMSTSGSRDLLGVLSSLASRMDLLVGTVLTHRSWTARLHGVGVLQDGSNHLPVSGVLLRSTGVAWDVRSEETHPLSIPVGTAGDSMDRVLIRCIEVVSSVVLVYHLSSHVSSSTTGCVVRSSMSLHSVLGSFMQWRVLGMESLCMHSVEGPKGELVVTLSVASTRTWRCRIRPADLGHVLSLQALSLGVSLSDVVMLVGTVDVVFGSVDL